jgi:hypothetical protein
VLVDARRWREADMPETAVTRLTNSELLEIAARTLENNGYPGSAYHVRQAAKKLAPKKRAQS